MQIKNYVLGAAIFLVIIGFYGWRNSANQNKTLQEALKNPQVIVKEKIVYKKVPPKIITKYVTTHNPNGQIITSSTTVAYNGDTVTLTDDAGSETKPVYPPFEWERRWLGLAEYDLNGGWGGGVGYQPFKALPLSVGGKYNTKNGLGVFGVVRF